MERYQTVDEMLGYAQQFHGELADYYDRRAESDADARLQMTLHYLAKHQRELACALQKYRADADGNVLESWLDHVPELETLPVLEDVTGNQATGSAETDAVALALEIDDRLIEAYESLTRSAGSETVAALFENLAEQQRNQQRQLRMADLRMADL